MTLRNAFYQWVRDQRITVVGTTIEERHKARLTLWHKFLEIHGIM